MTLVSRPAPPQAQEPNAITFSGRNGPDACLIRPLNSSALPEMPFHKSVERDGVIV
jgi:hypothetical protein